MMVDDQIQQMAERIAALETELQTTLQNNTGLTRELQEYRERVETERIRADRRSRLQIQEFANLTAELVAGRRVPAMEGVHIGVKVERPEYFDGGKTQDVDTWLFQVCEHLDITAIPERGRVP